jgi:hypothetical protein
MEDCGDLDHSDGVSGDEEYECKKCGKVFYMRIQDGGKFDFDEGTGRCDECNKVYCKECGDWRTFDEEYEKLCETCFNKKLLASFREWLDIFQEGSCYNYRENSGKSCDDCIFFCKKYCMIYLFEELLKMQLDPEPDKTFKYERTKRINQRHFAEWQKELKEAIGKDRKS